LIQQMLTESLLLSALGGIAGFLLTVCGTGLLLALASARIPRAFEIGLDWRVFCFLGVVSFGVGVVFGLAPAVSVSHVDVQPMIKRDYESGSSGNRRYRWRVGNLRDSLVVAEIAMAFVLLTGAGLLLQTFLRLQATPSGLITDRVLTLHMGVALRNYAERGSYNRYLQRLEERLNTVPGVRAVGFIQFLPLQNWGWTGGFSIIGHLPAEQEPRAELRYISPGYFRAFGIPIRKGRMFSNRDTSESPPVILINEALAKRYFNNEDPIGKRTDRGTIIGIVGDVRQASLDRSAAPEIYYPFAQNTAARSDEGVSLIVNTLGPPEAMTNAVRIAIHQVNPTQAIFDVRPMEKVVSDSLAGLDLYLWLVGVFAAIAVVLASAGIYGVMSYAVATRIREFAIRLALGADKRTLLKLVLGHGGRLIVGGLILGSAGTFALQHILRRFVVSVPALNLVMLFQLSVLFAVVAIAACAGPAAKATRLDPNANLRSE
jgi:putative ABC transport system permease protein